MIGDLLNRFIVKTRVVLGREMVMLPFSTSLTGKVLRKRKSRRAPIMPCKLTVIPAEQKFDKDKKGLDFSILPLKLFKKILINSNNYVHQINFSGSIEPFTNGDLPEMAALAVKNRIFTRSETFGFVFCERRIAVDTVLSGLHVLAITLFGLDDGIAGGGWKGVTFEKIVNGIRNIIKVKETYRSITPFLEINFVLLQRNMHDVVKAKKMARELGIKRFSVKNAYIPMDSAEFENKLELCTDFGFKEAIYKTKVGKYFYRTPNPRKCPYLYHGTVIRSNGDVAPCPYGMKSKYVMGNVYMDTVSGIWNSPSYKAIRSFYSISPEKVPVCSICPEGRVRNPYICYVI